MSRHRVDVETVIAKAKESLSKANAALRSIGVQVPSKDEALEKRKPTPEEIRAAYASLSEEERLHTLMKASLSLGHEMTPLSKGSVPLLRPVEVGGRDIDPVHFVNPNMSEVEVRNHLATLNDDKTVRTIKELMSPVRSK